MPLQAGTVTLCCCLNATSRRNATRLFLIIALNVAVAAAVEASDFDKTGDTFTPARQEGSCLDSERLRFDTRFVGVKW